MEDQEIIRLYFDRSEQAIRETDRKYGPYCTTVSMNVLHNAQDAEECVNDTWLWTWNHIPPEKPQSLRAYLGSIVRHISISRYRHLHAAKRSRDMETLLGEINDACPDPGSLPNGQDELKTVISEFLRAQSRSDRVIFVLRYYHAFPVKRIAEELDVKPGAVSRRLQVLRERLRARLEERGYRL